MSYQVAIPSHNRADTINGKTLRTLAEGGVPKERVTVFVAPSQLPEYRAKLDKGLVGTLVESWPTLQANRNFITRYYDPGTFLVNADDDIQDVVEKVNDTTVMRIQDLDAFFDEAFTKMLEQSTSLWGVYPSFNPLFMKPVERVGLWFCIGQLFGVLNGHEDRNMVSIASKEDYERTLKHWEANGAVVRFDNVACKSPMYGQGGLQSEEFDRHSMNRQEVRYLLSRWPNNVKIQKRRSKVGLEIRLVER